MKPLWKRRRQSVGHRKPNNADLSPQCSTKTLQDEDDSIEQSPNPSRSPVEISPRTAMLVMDFNDMESDNEGYGGVMLEDESPQSSCARSPSLAAPPEDDLDAWMRQADESDLFLPYLPPITRSLSVPLFNTLAPVDHQPQKLEKRVSFSTAEVREISSEVREEISRKTGKRLSLDGITRCIQKFSV